MKKILLTGANGQLGRALRKEYRDSVRFILTDMIGREVSPGEAGRAEEAGEKTSEAKAASADIPAELIRLDISDSEAVLAAVEEYRPDVIINCAAMTNVDGCDADPDAAFRANAIGPRNLAVAAKRFGAKLIHISTDYVFSGDADEPYTEFDTPSPVSGYGKSKLAGEEFVKSFADEWFILRTAWLYGDGKNFVRTMLSLSETHDEVSVVCDQQGSPTSAAELARMIRYLEPTSAYGVYHATCEGDTNWADFTEEIFALAGKQTKVNHVTSEEYARMNPKAANRPKYSILENRMIRLMGGFEMKDWHEAIKEYIKEII